MQTKLSKIFTNGSFLKGLMVMILLFLAWEIAVFIPNLMTPSVGLWLQSSLPVIVFVLLFVVVVSVRSGRLHLFSKPEPIALKALFLLLLLALPLGYFTFTIINVTESFVYTLIELIILLLAITIPFLCAFGNTGIAILILSFLLPASAFIRQQFGGIFGIAAGSVLQPLLFFQKDITGLVSELGILNQLPFEVLLVTCIFGGWLVSLYYRDGQWPRTPLDWPIIIFLIGCLASIPFSSDVSRSVALFIWGGLAPFMLYYVIVDCVKISAQRRIIFVALFIFAAITDLYNVYRIFQFKNVSLSNFTEDDRVSVLFWTGSMFVTALWPLMLVLCLSRKERPGVRILAIFAIFVGGADTLLSFCRSVWLVILLQLVLLFLFSRRLRYYILSFVLVSAIGIFIGLNTWNALSNALRPQLFSGLEERNLDILTSGRTLLWHQSWEWIKERPIIGIGLGTSINLFMQYFHEANAHNEYLQFWLEGGIVPALAVLAIEIVVMIEGVRSIISTNDMRIRELRFCMLLGCIAWFILSFDGSLWTAYPSLILQRVILWGLVMSWRFEDKNQQSQEKRAETMPLRIRDR